MADTSDLLARPLLTDLSQWTTNAMGGESPVDVDLTLLIHLGLFLLTWLLLKKLLFDPYLAVRNKREAGIGGNRELALAMQLEAQEALEEYDRRLAQAREEANEVRATVRQEGADEQKAILGEAYQSTAEHLSARRAELQQQVEAARAEMRAEAQGLSRLIVERLLPS